MSLKIFLKNHLRDDLTSHFPQKEASKMDENIEKITKNLQVTTIEVNRENVTRKQFLG